jgi:hypothetical protein
MGRIDSLSQISQALARKETRETVLEENFLSDCIDFKGRPFITASPNN